MAVRTTVDIPEPLHDRLRDRAERSGASDVTKGIGDWLDAKLRLGITAQPVH
jgi:hypothetical protein